MAEKVLKIPRYMMQAEECFIALNKKGFEN